MPSCWILVLPLSSFFACSFFQRLRIFNILVLGILVPREYPIRLPRVRFGRGERFFGSGPASRPPRYSRIIDVSRPRRRCGCSTGCFPSCGKRRIRWRTEYLCSSCEIYRVASFYFFPSSSSSQCLCHPDPSAITLRNDPDESGIGRKRKRKNVVVCEMHYAYRCTKQRLKPTS